MLGFLEKYEFLATWILLPIEIVFLYFVLKEFKMTRKSFEWQEREQKEKRKNDIYYKISFFAFLCFGDFCKKYPERINARFVCHNTAIQDICNKIDNNYHFPNGFCKDMINRFINMNINKSIEDFLQRLQHYCNSLLKTKVDGKRTLSQEYVEYLRKKYFKNDNEIDKIYNDINDLHFSDK